MSERRAASGGQRQVRTEDIALVEAVGGDDCALLAPCLGQGGLARTGDAQVGLASSVHDDAQAGGGCSLVLVRVLVLSLSATGRLSELAGVRVCDQRSASPWGAARGSSWDGRGLFRFRARRGTEVGEVGVAEQGVARLGLTKAPPPLCWTLDAAIEATNDGPPANSNLCNR
jgi:hypothetical protein